MTLQDVAMIVWRRWWIVLLVPLIGAFAAVLAGGSAEAVADSFGGSATMTLASGEDNRSVDKFEFIAIETPEIRNAVAAQLDFQVAGTVDVRAIQSIGAIQIMVSGQPDQPTATNVVAEYASALNSYETDRRILDRDEKLATVLEREADLRIEIADLTARLTSAAVGAAGSDQPRIPDRVTETELAAASESLAGVLGEKNRLEALTDADFTPFERLGSIETFLESDDAPIGPRVRLLLGTLFGLFAGVALALGLHRFDTRLFTRQEAASAYELPVVAEIPKTSWLKRRGYRIVSREYPTDKASEAYRVLRSSIARSRATQLAETDEDTHRPGTVVMITSASAAVGKSTSSANLAVVAADAGNSVLVVNADLRHPSLQEYFGVDPDAIGLSDVSIAKRQGQYGSSGEYVVDTNVPNVEFLPHGTSVVSPGDVLADAAPVIDSLRGDFDLVILDTPPMLAGNDVDELLPAADLVLQVARSGRTTHDEGLWANETIQRLRTPSCGLLLIGARSELERRSAARRRPGLKPLLSGLLAQVSGGSHRPWSGANSPTLPVDESHDDDY